MTLRHSNLVIMGMQWGDEGKGKVIDLLSRHFKHIVRFQGGNNAGHTVVVDGESLALHQVPSGTLHPDCQLVVASGVVLNLKVFHEEIRRLRERNIDIMSRLFLSEKAHLILPHHIALDQWRESGSGKVGTTGRGIGPAYEMKASRMGIRLGDVRHPHLLEERVELGYREVQLRIGTSATLPSLKSIVSDIIEQTTLLLPRIINVQEYLRTALAKHEPILFEGAQASLLDLDHGTYPYVTSSNCSVGGLLTGTGLPYQAIGQVCGITKAYATRVGSGPFPSEDHGTIGETIRSKGREFGTTTGRPRRCGWFDAPIVKHSAFLNGVSGLAVMKLDVLAGFDEVKLITGYSDGSGGTTSKLPSHELDWKEIVPIYKSFPGWGPIDGMTAFNELPQAAQSYLKALEDSVEVPIAYVSTGADRKAGFMMQGMLSPYL